MSALQIPRGLNAAYNVDIVRLINVFIITIIIGIAAVQLADIPFPQSHSLNLHPV